MSTPVAPLESVVGKTCPFCQTPLKPHDLVITCRSCQMPHHEECWQENGGCTTFGCTTDEGETQPLRPSPVMAAMPQTLTIELADLDDGTPQRDEETVGSSCGATVIRVFLTAVIILLVVPLVIWMLWAAFAILFQ